GRPFPLLPLHLIRLIRGLAGAWRVRHLHGQGGTAAHSRRAARPGRTGRGRITGDGRWLQVTIAPVNRKKSSGSNGRQNQNKNQTPAGTGFGLVGYTLFTQGIFSVVEF